MEVLEEDAPIEAGSPEGLDAEALERRAAALTQVRKFGDPVLRSEASPVTEFDQALAEEAERMIGLMRDGMGVGLAATQLGILRRILVFQVGPDATPTVLVNPQVEWSSDDLVTADEVPETSTGVKITWSASVPAAGSEICAWTVTPSANVAPPDGGRATSATGSARPPSIALCGPAA